MELQLPTKPPQENHRTKQKLGYLAIWPASNYTAWWHGQMCQWLLHNATTMKVECLGVEPASCWLEIQCECHNHYTIVQHVLYVAIINQNSATHTSFTPFSRWFNRFMHIFTASCPPKANWGISGWISTFLQSPSWLLQERTLLPVCLLSSCPVTEAVPVFDVKQ